MTFITLEQRQSTITRLSDNLGRIGFFRSAPIPDDICLKLSGSIERKAYNAAEAASRTTTGERPKSEVVQAYARKLGQLVIEAVRDGALVNEEDADDSIMVGVGGAVLDLSGGQREFFDKDGAEKALAAMLAQGGNISKVRLSQKSFGQEAALVAQRAFKNCAASLVDADLSDVIAGRPEDEALKSLTIMTQGLEGCKLKHLNLSDNALGEKGIRAAQAAIVTQPRLESITLENVGCSVHACKALAELLPNPGALKKIHLYNNMSGDEGAAHIASILARAPLMEDFKMVYSRVGGAGGVELARGLMAGSALVRLDLSGNPMTPTFAKALGESLKTQRNLKVLNLNDTLLEDAGAEQIAVALAHSAPYLEELELATNEITEKGAKAIARCLMGKPSLQRLNLRENELKDNGTKIICNALSGNDSLRVLDLCENMMRQAGAVIAAKCCASRPGFELLALDANWIQEEGIEALKEIMTKGAAGLAALGSLEDNDAEGYEESEGEEEEEGDVAAAKLAEQIAASAITDGA